VAVFGRSDVTAHPWESERSTLIAIPETTCYIYDYQNTYSVMRPQMCLYCIVMSAMVVERSQLVAMIDRTISITVANNTITNYNQYHCSEQYESLWTWKTQLILERIRRNRAARTVQRQFRESMSNPAYDMCKRRLLREYKLLREFAEGISV
jgi:putative hemolysin